MDDANSNNLAEKIWMAWSSGKDSAFTLYKLQLEKSFSIAALLTTVTAGYERISMHSTRKELLQLQANRLSLHLEIIEIPEKCSNEIYKKQMSLAIAKAESLNIQHIAFGDISLESVRKYRENQLRKTKINPIFPLWGEDAAQLSRSFINAGFKAIVIAIDKTKMQQNMLGHEYNMAFLKKLPSDVDPCGENGEFHTFVYDAPIFNSPICCALGQRVTRNNMMYIDLLPGSIR